MKVICVKPFKTSSEFKGLPEPLVGDIDIVLFERTQNGRLYYSLERFGNENGYAARNFAILPDTSADEMQEENHEALIYQR